MLYWRRASVVVAGICADRHSRLLVVKRGSGTHLFVEDLLFRLGHAVCLAAVTSHESVTKLIVRNGREVAIGLLVGFTKKEIREKQFRAVVLCCGVFHLCTVRRYILVWCVVCGVHYFKCADDVWSAGVWSPGSWSPGASWS